MIRTRSVLQRLMHSSSIVSSSSSTSSWKRGHEKNWSEQQIKQLDDQIVLVDQHDNVIGPSSKKECHLRPPKGSVEERGLLHRAFSVFLFNSKDELLLQQRSSSKITFPDQFTNTCCSHPRYNQTELDERDNIGIKIAAQRRLEFELGISSNEVNLFSNINTFLFDPF